MIKKIMLLTAIFAAASASAQEPSAASFSDAVAHWSHGHDKASYARFNPDQHREIATNIVAYQNADGGWAKNLDMLARLDPDSVILSLKPRSRLSTLDNANVYTQVEYLSNVYTLTGDTLFRTSARRGIEYMLSTQYPNGGWRGWDADAITFNDGIMYGVLSAWLEILDGKPYYNWVDETLRARIRASWDRGLALVLRCQWTQGSTKTAWAQQYDHTTLLPMKARAYELPSLTASESADIVMLLMRIKKPSPEVVAAVKAAVAWLDRVKISEQRVVWVAYPEGLPEDPKITRDRVVVADSTAAPIWARYYDLETNDYFFTTRAGDRVATLAEVPAERRTGYAWYGVWGGKVLKKYPEWLRKVEKNK